jgi:hypothetical protein
MCAELVRCPMHMELARSPSAEQLHVNMLMGVYSPSLSTVTVTATATATVTVTVTVTVQDVRSLGEICIVRAEHVSAEVKSR